MKPLGVFAVGVLCGVVGLILDGPTDGYRAQFVLTTVKYTVWAMAIAFLAVGLWKLFEIALTLWALHHVII